MMRLPESEQDIMLALWESDQTLTPRSYFDRKLEQKEWSVNALNSFLTRLEDKGFIESVKQGKSKYYYAVVSRDEYLSHTGKTILKKLYNDSIKSFMLSISGHEGLNEMQIKELQEYLVELREGKKND